jgi:hypothetical protein
MTDKKLSDNEIIKALECCTNEDRADCEQCPLDDLNRNDCFSLILHKHSLDLINRQKAEIERLEGEIDKQYEQEKADILGNMSDGGTSCHWCIEQNRAEAIKEFADVVERCNQVIDNLVKEMVGEDNA